jgi:toxin-antitoxin system PIN domain toxin
MKNSVYLLDANILIALGDVTNTEHPRATAFFKRGTITFATCPITQGGLLRHYMRVTQRPSIHDAKRLLASFTGLPTHQFWSDDIDYDHIPTRGVIGHRQVTDAYLVALAAKHGGVLATMDQGTAAIHSGVLLIPRHS